MKLNLNSPLLRLSVELTADQIVELAKNAIAMAAWGACQEEVPAESDAKEPAADEPEQEPAQIWGGETAEGSTEQIAESEGEDLRAVGTPALTTSCGDTNHCASAQGTGSSKKEGPGMEKPSADAPAKAGYTGFMHLKCDLCDQVKDFCAKKPIDYFICDLGHRTPLANIRKIGFRCECGKWFCYQTNLQDEIITMDCFSCGSPIDLEWNRKKQVYEKMK